MKGRSYLLASLWVGIVAGAAPGADPVLDLIPPKAIATVQVNGIDRTLDRLDALLKNAVPDREDEASRAVRDAVGEALAGRDRTALRPDGRVLLAIADVEKLPDDAAFTFLFPAKSWDDFRTRFLTDEERKSLKKEGNLQTVQWEDRKAPYYVVNLPSHVVVTSSQENATRYAAGTIGGVAKLLSAEMAKTFLEADVGLFINVREVSARYGEQLKRFKSLADLFLKGDTLQGVSKTQLEQLQGAIGATFEVVEQGTAAVISVEFRPDGLALHGAAQFPPTSSTSALLKKYQPSPLTELGTLPAGEMSYAANSLSRYGLTGAALSMDSFSVDDEAADTKLADLRKQLAAYDRGVILSVGKMTGATLEWIESKDAAQIVEARLAMLKALTKQGSFGGIPLKAAPGIQEKAETVGGFTLHRARLTYDFDRAVADLPEEQREAARSAARRARGGDEFTFWIGTNGSAVLQLTAVEWPTARALAENFLDQKGNLGEEPAYQAVRKQLPANASMIVLFNAAQTARSVLGTLRESRIPGAGKTLPEPKVVAGKPVYAGVALVLQGEHGRFDVFVPAAAAEPVRKLIEPLLDNGP